MFSTHATRAGAAARYVARGPLATADTELPRSCGEHNTAQVPAAVQRGNGRTNRKPKNKNNFYFILNVPVQTHTTRTAQRTVVTTY
jgi:hypothetical protein